MQEFSYSENGARVERRSVDRSEALFVYGNALRCGNCHAAQQNRPAPSACEHEDCRVKWKYIVINSHSNVNLHDFPHMTAIDLNCLKSPEFMHRDESFTKTKQLGARVVTVALNELGASLLYDPTTKHENVAVDNR